MGRASRDGLRALRLRLESAWSQAGAHGRRNVVSLVARWFPDRRGLAIGIVAAGYGMGAGPILAAAKRKPPTLSP